VGKLGAGRSGGGNCGKLALGAIVKLGAVAPVTLGVVMTSLGGGGMLED
jgi:hypothetical protein